MPAERAIPNAEGTAYPVWIVVRDGGRHGVDQAFRAGPWFSREAAEKWLDGHRHQEPGSYVFCASGHMSQDYRHLCERGSLARPTAILPEAP